jgi:peptide/nickel transport system permease protein
MATDSTATPGALDAAAPAASPQAAPSAGLSPWALARRRLRRNKVALAFGVLFVLLVVVCLAAPIWASQIADTTPTRNGLSDTITIDGQQVNVVDFDGVPIGPQWFKAGGKYFLGADSLGRDVMVRLLYGGRNSLQIGIIASVLCTALAVLLGMLAGFYRGWVDGVIARGLDVLWSFPVLLLGVALGVSLALGGLNLGPIDVSAGSLWVPTLIIGFVSITYLARVIRGEVLSLREKEFVEAARAQGMSGPRIMFSEILPNVASTILVFFPLTVANAVLLESALSFLGAGVQPPSPSWGTMMSDGIKLLITSPHLTIAPGVMLVITVLALNVFGDGVRDALDPRAKLRVEEEADRA